MSVTKISEYSSRETLAVLKKLTGQAERGEITGLAFACKFGPEHHGIGLTDDYWRNPLEALAVSTRVQHAINLVIDGKTKRLVE